MRPIVEVADLELVWVQPSMLHQDFELRAGDEVVATLVFHRSSLAEAATSGDRWTLKREGFWHPHVTVRVAGAEENICIFRPGWTGGGALDFPDGRSFRFGTANFWHTQWDWQRADGMDLVHFHNKQGFLKSGAAVDVISPPLWRGSTAGGGEGELLSLLVVLGWYLLIMVGRDAAASSAGNVAMGSA